METAKNYIIAALALLFVMTSGGLWIIYSQLQDQQQALTAQDIKIQQFNAELGIAHSELLTEKELNSKYKRDAETYPAELQKIIKDFNLRLQSREQTIVALQNRLHGGATTVVVRPAPISVPETNSGTVSNPAQQIIEYTWQDNLGRFHLIDPDIFVKGNEEFRSEQNMRITGRVLYGKGGNLQIKKVDVQEVVSDGIDEKGKTKYRPVEGSTVKVVDSNFEYINTLPIKQKGIGDLLTLRVIGSYDTQLMPGVGLEIINLGRLIDYANVGLSTRISADVSDPLKGSLAHSRIGVGLEYSLLQPLFDSNVAVGASVSTPFNNFGKDWIFSLDAILYLTNDLIHLGSDK